MKEKAAEPSAGKTEIHQLNHIEKEINKIKMWVRNVSRFMQVRVRTDTEGSLTTQYISWFKWIGLMCQIYLDHQYYISVSALCFGFIRVK